MTTTTMLRYNTGKPRLSLVPASFFRALWFPGGIHTALLYDTAHVLTFGAMKYDANNWRKAGSWLEVVDCAMRHMIKIQAGESHDVESGIHHAAHVSCNLAFLLEFDDQQSGKDDRFAIEKIAEYDGEDLFEMTWEALLAFKDGADSSFLRLAAQYLAEWYETMPTEARAFQPGTSEFAPIKAVIN